MDRKRIQRVLAATLAGGLLAAGAGCGGDDEPSAESAGTDGSKLVTVMTFNFQPDPVEVEAGTTVRWENSDETIHTVVGGTREKPDRSALDGSMDQGDSYEHTFAEPGTYQYFCDRHSGPGMTAEVVVR